MRNAARDDKAHVSGGVPADGGAATDISGGFVTSAIRFLLSFSLSLISLSLPPLMNSHFSTSISISISTAMPMKANEVGLWSIWLFGLLLIVLSLNATQRLSFFKEHNGEHRVSIAVSKDQVDPRVTIFSATQTFSGSVGARQSLAIRSWLALSQQITVVLFSQDPSAISFASSFASQVLVEKDIDFSFLGTPFFHSMVARSMSFKSEISVLVDPEMILLPNFISVLNYAYELDCDWLLVASSMNISQEDFERRFPQEDGKVMKTLEEMLGQKRGLNHCDEKLLLAWNNGDVPLYNGVVPSFLYGKGVHNKWVINEALTSEFRFVFDASLTISSFYFNDPETWSTHTDGDSDNFSCMRKRSWEYFCNSHVGALYGSSFYHETNYSSIVKLVKCGDQYIFFNRTQNIVYPCINRNARKLQKRQIFSSLRKMKALTCSDVFNAMEKTTDFSLTSQMSLSAPLDLPFSLETLLPLVADENKTVVLAVAGYSYKEMLMSWVCRLRRIKIKNFLICALDRETYEFSVLQGLPVFIDPFAPTNISFNGCHFGTKCFQRVTKVKSRMVLKILKLGYNVLLSDVDVYWFKNPLHFLYSFGPSVLAAQSDEFKNTGPINLPRRLNSGFYFAHSNNMTIAAMEKVVRHAATSGLSEQPSFYDTLCGQGGSNRIDDSRCVESKTNLTVHFLDRKLFPNGAYQGLWKKKNVRAACRKKGCLILHNNWINGRVKKLERQISSGLWEYDMTSRMCLHNWQRE